MKHTLRRCGLFAIALVISVAGFNATAPAAVDLSTGIRYVYPAGTAADCGTKAQTALTAYLQDPVEAPQGSGEWSATGPIGSHGPATNTAAATVRCFPLDQGYVVTFDCAVESPNNPYTAEALCLDLAHNFSGKDVTPLAVATPAPTGCTTANLVGTWTSDNAGGPTLTVTPDGNFTDGDGVSGNWVLYDGTDVTLTYYGNHNLKLSPDGKHMSGGDYHFTRKC